MKIISILSVALLIAAAPTEHKSHEHKGNHKCNDGEQFSPKAKKCLPIEKAIEAAPTEAAKATATKTVAPTAAKK